MTVLTPLVALLISAGLASCGRADGAATRKAGGAVAVAASGQRGSDPGTAEDSLSPRADRARIQGDSTAPVWMVIVSDFQCPYCRTWHDESYPALVKEYVATGKVRMAYLNYPLPMHQHALPAADAAMCAGAQGKFWPMHDAIFASQDKWTPLASAAATFDSLAVAAGVEMASWRKCVSTQALRPLVQADYDRSAAAGVRSTPSFLIGESRLAGAQPIAEFRRAIDAALVKAGRATAR
ncbi:MAG: hypothetical protein NVS1B4_26970 [Gemmatimonadaceae bacterium]